jgi:hypothetical protein
MGQWSVEQPPPRVPERESSLRRSYRIAGAVAATVAAVAAGVAGASGTATAATVAKAKYQAALKEATQNVHFITKTTQQGITLEAIGDTGKTSGSQVLAVQDGSVTEELAVVLIGSTGFLKGNESALERVLGLTTAQSSTYMNKWLSFPTSNDSLSELVGGLRDSEIASELAMTGPYTMGGTKMIAGQLTQAIRGQAATSSGTKVPIVLYVTSTGPPRPVREVTNPDAKSPAIQATVTFSNWGETTHPVAPTTSTPLVPLLPAAG